MLYKMAQFNITATVNIEAKDREEADRKLQQAIYNEGQLSELGFDLLRNAQVDAE